MTCELGDSGLDLDPRGPKALRRYDGLHIKVPLPLSRPELLSSASNHAHLAVRRPVVVLLTPWYLPHIGGLERHVQAICQGLSSLDFRILMPRLPGTVEEEQHLSTGRARFKLPDRDSPILLRCITFRSRWTRA